MVRRRHHVHDRNAGQIVSALIAKQLHIVVVGVNMHAIEHIGDGVTALIHQQGQPLFRIVTGNLGVLELLAQTQVLDHPVHHQGKHIPVITGHHAAGPLLEGRLYGLGRKGIFQQDHWHRLAQTLEVGHGRFKTAIAEGRPAQHQLPGATFQRAQQIIFAQGQLCPGCPAGIAQHIHQLLGLILGIMGDQ